MSIQITIALLFIALIASGVATLVNALLAANGKIPGWVIMWATFFVLIVLAFGIHG